MIVALDIATQTGVAYGRHDAAPTCYSVDLGKGRSEDARLSQVLSLTHQLIVDHKPDLVIVEAAIGGKNASAFLTGLVYCVRGCCFNRGVPVEQVAPATVRKHFIGKAYTSRDFPGLSRDKAKIAIKELVLARCKQFRWDVPDLDAADAAACWEYGCATHVRGYQSKPSGELFT